MRCPPLYQQQLRYSSATGLSSKSTSALLSIALASLVLSSPKLKIATASAPPGNAVFDNNSKNPINSSPPGMSSFERSTFNNTMNIRVASNAASEPT